MGKDRSTALLERKEIELLDYHPSVDDLGDVLLDGLRAEQKTLPPKFFYDEAGSKLFDQITELPEYYPTRTEVEIMHRCGDEIAECLGPQVSLIEFGSGSSTKTDYLLRKLDDVAAYVPVDISKEHLLNAARRVDALFPKLQVAPVCADFTQPFGLPKLERGPRRNVVYFPGSTIGNFHPDQAKTLLNRMARLACRDGALLIGVDLRKEKSILERAYNDAAGVTARFNLNMLVRFNREYDANFDLDAFHHRAVFNEQASRIEMHLVSDRKQAVTVAGETFEFEKDEYILTECSYKYSIDDFAALAAGEHFLLAKVWTDDDKLFSVLYLECDAPYRSGVSDGSQT